jgi:hypothetical protein
MAVPHEKPVQLVDGALVARRVQEEVGIHLVGTHIRNNVGERTLRHRVCTCALCRGGVHAYKPLHALTNGVDTSLMRKAQWYGVAS